MAKGVPASPDGGLTQGDAAILRFLAALEILETLLADAPEAYGTQHTLPDVRPEGKGFFDGLNPVDRHGMDWVIAGTRALD